MVDAPSNRLPHSGVSERKPLCIFELRQKLPPNTRKAPTRLLAPARWQQRSGQGTQTFWIERFLGRPVYHVIELDLRRKPRSVSKAPMGSFVTITAQHRRLLRCICLGHLSDRDWRVHDRNAHFSDTIDTQRFEQHLTDL